MASDDVGIVTEHERIQARLERWVPRLSLRGWLMLVMVTVTLPLVLVSGGLLWHQQLRQEGEQIDELRRRADVGARAVQRRFEQTQSALALLAAAMPPRSNSEPAQAEASWLGPMAERVLVQEPDWQAVLLLDERGAVIHSALREAVNVPLSHLALPARAARGVAWPPVSGLFPLGPAGSWGVLVVLPEPVRTVGAGAPRWLAVVLAAEAVQAVLEAQLWPEGWQGGVIDGRYTVVAVSDGHSLTPGQVLAEPLRRATIAADGNAYEGKLAAGVPVLLQRIPIIGTDWHLILGRDVAALHSQRLATLWRFLALCALVLLLGLVEARLIAWVLGRPMAQLPAWAETGLGTLPTEDTLPTTLGGLGPSTLPGDLGNAGVTAPGAAGGPPVTVPGALLPERRALHASPVREIDQLVAHLNGLRLQQAQLINQLHVAQLDPLTELAGRQLCLDVCAVLLRNCRLVPHAVLALFYIDLDGFKQINDREGHAAGDSVLRRVGQLLRASARQGDVAGRIGGDEFVLAMALEREQALAVCDAVAARLIGEVARFGPGLGCSVGVALSDDPDETFEGLLARADAAMLEAKRRGKNRMHLSDRRGGAHRPLPPPVEMPVHGLKAGPAAAAPGAAPAGPAGSAAKPPPVAPPPFPKT